MPKIKLLFSERLSRFYAIFLVFLIPVLIIANGLWRINIYQNYMTQELMQKAQITAKVFASSLATNFATRKDLDIVISDVKNNNPEVSAVSILSANASEFPVTFSTDPTDKGLIIADSDLINIYSDHQSIAKVYVDQSQKVAKRYWLAAAPISDQNNQVLGILVLKMNSTNIDTLNRAAITQSLLLLVFTVFIVFLLLINYFRFFEYFIDYKKIQQVDKMKDEFISMVSHEVKTPLATVKGYLDMMFQGLTGKIDDRAKEHLQKISANVNRLDLLVSELLDVSRLEQDRMQFDMQPTDASLVVTNLLHEIGDQAVSKGLVIEHNVPKQLPPVFVDPDRLHQIMENLVGNAIKYTPAGKITINYELNQGTLAIKVKDTGFGIASRDAKRLFERFYRIKNEKTVDISGTGLGLWISRAIAKRMNGDILVKSQEGVGSEFTLVLPFIKDKG